MKSAALHPDFRLCRQLAARRISKFCSVLLLGCCPLLATAASSNVLIALEADGRSYTAQHTISSNGSLVLLDLPGSVIPQQVQFMGPERATIAEAHQLKRDRLTLWSGTAIVRYHHQYGFAAEQDAEGAFILRVQSISRLLQIDEEALDSSSITWIFPNSFDLLSWSSSDAKDHNWLAENNTLSWRQNDGEPVTLEVIYRNRTTQQDVIDQCAEGATMIDACSPDADEDLIPDYRDICITHAPAAADLKNAANTDDPDNIPNNSAHNDFGCLDGATMMLDTVNFISGQSYLDINARQLLDRVANALQNFPERIFEVAAHTDNLGSAARNRSLSKNRAETVRHYLMLRGVSPNQITANGYGENFPIQDNASTDGRRANRRIELKQLSR